MSSSVIEFLGPDGVGGARLSDGRTLRVPGAFVGDRVTWRPDAERGEDRRTVWGMLVEVERASDSRRAASCPHDAACGGCDWSQLEPATQQASKASRVQRALHLDTPVPIVASPRPDAYRARIQLAVQPHVGYRRRRSHAVVEVDGCGIARPEVQAALARLRQLDSPLSGLERVELRSDGERCIFAFDSEGGVPARVRADLQSLGDVAIDGRRLHGEPTLTLSVAGRSLRASPKSFFQVNLEANELLVRAVLAQLAELRPERMLDLFAGIGNFGVPISARGIPVVAVERPGQAIEDARHNAAGLPLEVVARDAQRFDPSRHPADVVLLDPPRAGAGKLVQRLLPLRPRALVYVACNPVAAARDLRPALRQGYRLAHVEAFDLFPDTHHVEALFVCVR